jgi:hypothetical protein
MVFIIITLGLFSAGSCLAGTIAGDMIGNSGIRRGFTGIATAEQRDNARAVEIISIALVLIIGVILLIKNIVKKQKIKKLIIFSGLIIIAILVITELYIFNLS